MFEFFNLPYDTYTIYTDIPGYPMDSSYVITLNAGADSVGNADYYVDSNSVYIDITTSVTEENQNPNLLSVYPNPAAAYVNVIIRGEEIAKATIRFADMSGRILLNEVKTISSGTPFKIDLSSMNLSPGVYLMSVEAKGKTNWKKIVIH
jgi:hypothetical protein